MSRVLIVTGALVALVFVLAVATIFAGQAKRTEYAPVSDSLPQLVVAFADPAWGGETLPDGMWCDRYEVSRATSPALFISNIPAGTNAIILEFNDENVFFLDEGGGHGAIGFRVQGPEAALPAVPPGTRDIGPLAFVEHDPLIPFGLMGEGYLPPCSGGRGNLYTVDVLAVDKPDDGEGRLLARGTIALGRY